MKKNRIFSAGILCLAVISCHRFSCHPNEAAPPSGLSLYQMESVWRDAQNREIRFDALKGKVEVVAMVYTSCEYACPRIVGDMKRIESSLTPAQLEKTGFVLISIDPKRDIPKKLKTFSEKESLNPDRWNLLTGSESDVREMAALLGVRYKEIEEGFFSHSNLITILNRKGEILHQQKGLGTDPDESLGAISRALKD